MILHYQICNSDCFKTVRDVLKKHFKLSSRLLLKLKKLKLIYLNNANCYLDKLVSVGDTVSFSLDYEENNSNIVPAQMELDIIYEDEALIIINKPPFVAIHPTAYHFDDTLSNGVRYYFDQIGLKKKIRPVNRLDRNTSGLVIFAKNEYVQEQLILEMKIGNFEKRYIGFVEGNLNDLLPNNNVSPFLSIEKDSNGFICGSISAPISRKENSIIERKVDVAGASACTHFRIIKTNSNYAQLEFILVTGRTHQIRVHCQHIGHPLLGDTLYGTPSKLINRQALHSYHTKFIHPITNTPLKIKAPLPPDLLKLT